MSSINLGKVKKIIKTDIINGISKVDKITKIDKIKSSQ